MPIKLLETAWILLFTCGLVYSSWERSVEEQTMVASHPFRCSLGIWSSGLQAVLVSDLRVYPADHQRADSPRLRDRTRYKLPLHCRRDAKLLFQSVFAAKLRCAVDVCHAGLHCMRRIADIHCMSLKFACFRCYLTNLTLAHRLPPCNSEIYGLRRQ